MSHLTYGQRNKFLNTALSFPDLSGIYVQMTYTNKKPKKVKTQQPKYIVEVREFVEENKVITLEELTQYIINTTSLLDNYPLHISKGYLKQTIEYLEQDGYICYLPDTDGELTFCNYKYYEEIND